MWTRNALAVLALSGAPVLAKSLLDALQANGFTLFAQQLQTSPPPVDLNMIGPNVIVYAPMDAALAREDNEILTRRTTDEEAKDTAIYFANMNSVTLKRQAAVCLQSAGSTLSTFLNDPEWVNLGPGRNQSIVEKNMAFVSAPVVYTGLGAASKVTAGDIPFDGGVIRPVSDIFALPRNLSYTLPFLNADKFGDAVQRAGMADELNNMASITVLAPDNAVLGDIDYHSADVLLPCTRGPASLSNLSKYGLSSDGKPESAGGSGMRTNSSSMSWWYATQSDTPSQRASAVVIGEELRRVEEEGRLRVAAVAGRRVPACALHAVHDQQARVRAVAVRHAAVVVLCGLRWGP
ncbi:hypothetical protein MFIFM68171_02767 [Madurella fahalii]|uniref:Uncharacterized protein n=1 Tax=Madurella fahalii TaxID=1157608 RepID=A0ABQ0G480_9PEZI